MGGVLIVFAAIVAPRWSSRNRKRHGAPAHPWSTLAFGLIGFVDDFIIVVEKRSLGLHSPEQAARPSW